MRGITIILMAISKILPTYLFDGINLYPPSSKILIYDSTDGKIIDLLSTVDCSFEDVCYLDGLVAPGLVNAHCHLELSHLEGKIARYCGLPQFLLEVIARRQLHSEAEIIMARQKILQTLELSYQQGVRVIGDIVSTPLSLTVKQEYADNINDIRLHNFIELIGFDAVWPERKKRQFLQLYEDFNRYGLNASFALHAPYSVGQDLLNQLAFMKPKISTIHNQEAAAENELYLYGRGKFIDFYKQLNLDYKHFQPPACSSFQYFLPYLLNSTERRIFVHNTFMQLSDIQFFLQQSETTRINSFFAICARANEYIEHSLPSSDILQELRDYLVIGTDSLASNTDLSILKEMQFLQAHYNVLTKDLLFWATANGARALGLEREYGYLHKGFSPGIIRIYPVDETGEILPNSILENIA